MLPVKALENLVPEKVKKNHIEYIMLEISLKPSNMLVFESYHITTTFPFGKTIKHL